jgi:hypothetical protein
MPCCKSSSRICRPYTYRYTAAVNQRFRNNYKLLLIVVQRGQQQQQQQQQQLPPPPPHHNIVWECRGQRLATGRYPATRPDHGVPVRRPVGSDGRAAILAKVPPLVTVVLLPVVDHPHMCGSGGTRTITRVAMAARESVRMGQ